MTTDGRPRILLAWESGAGRGHIVTLRTVAQALGDRFAYDASLCLMDHAAEIAPLCDMVFPGARLYHDPAIRSAPGAPRTATWGEFLGDTGFRDPAFLTAQVHWWREVLTARCTDLVIADYAPCALMAAHSMGIPAVAVGTGYGIPPQGLARFPHYLPDHGQCLYDEGETLAIVNRAVIPAGVAPLAHLSDVYRRSDDLVRTIPLLDPYRGLRSQPLLPPVAGMPPPPAGQGDEVFVYFSTTELGNPDVVTAICSLGLPVRAYCPGITPDVARSLTEAGVMLEEQAVPPALIAGRSRLIVHSGQHGILCLGLAAGLPQVAIPQHMEQLFHARRCEPAGVLRVVTREERTADGMRDIIRQAHGDDAMATAAQALAAKLRADFAADPAALIRDRIIPLIG